MYVCMYVCIHVYVYMNAMSCSFFIMLLLIIFMYVTCGSLHLLEPLLLAI